MSMHEPSPEEQRGDWKPWLIGAALWLLAVVVLLIYLAAHGWRRRDARVQLATGLLGSYLALGGLLVHLAARGGDLQVGLHPINTVLGANFRIGADNSGGRFTGLIDDVRVYDRALSAEEVEALANPLE